jgi:hypothetical protein
MWEVVVETFEQLGGGGVQVAKLTAWESVQTAETGGGSTRGTGHAQVPTTPFNGLPKNTS